VRWLKLAAAGMLAAVVVLAQGNAGQSSGADPGMSLREIAVKRTAEWESLAKALEAKIARLLPCDPPARAAIEEVSRASEARLAALGAVLKAELTQANADTEVARLAFAAEDASLREAEAEVSDSQQEQAAVDRQLADLTASAKRREGLEDARKKLSEIAAIVAARATSAEEQVQLRVTLDMSLRDLLAADHARLTALQVEQAALSAEVSRWSDYYVARLARAQTECSITTTPTRKKKP
jgi:hypothetical protein